MGSRPLTPRKAHNLPVDAEQEMLERELAKAFEEFQQEQDEDVKIDEDGDMDSPLDEPVHICTELGEDNPDPFVPDEESSRKTKLTFFRVYTPLSSAEYAADLKYNKRERDGETDGDLTLRASESSVETRISTTHHSILCPHFHQHQSAFMPILIKLGPGDRSAPAPKLYRGFPICDRSQLTRGFGLENGMSAPLGCYWDSCIAMVWGGVAGTGRGRHHEAG
ncbi:hypothetical protein M405DRAFT_847159 [Rhizopogon salebrosus TDB-379]|nr:hypothetical protein M405DRAFT_847159 [Rhizopogon salebrosus TDB-379]